MAHRKKSRKHKTHRRHRVGAVSGMGKVLVDTAAVIAGAAAGAFINQALKTALPSLPAWAPAGIIVAGGVLVEKQLGKKNEAIASAGTGLAAIGGVLLLNETFISVPGISGVGFVTNYDRAAKPGLKMQHQVGAPGFMDKSIGSTRDMAMVSGILTN